MSKQKQNSDPINSFTMWFSHAFSRNRNAFPLTKKLYPVPKNSKATTSQNVDGQKHNQITIEIGIVISSWVFCKIHTMLVKSIQNDQTMEPKTV